ncbi:MAG: GTPase ObgE [Desulfobacterales bacterium]|nr:GTPase ObgE [Desulfobacterales bacterium]
MKFIDEVTIIVTSGDGGSGCVSFRREKFVPKGGPDGGDGGKGGDVIFKASSQKRTLYDFHFRRNFKAEKGGYGRGKCQTGKNGQDLIIEIPPGTLVKEVDSETVIKDFDNDEELVVAKGGRGGKGNKWFTSATYQAPKFAQPGEKGQTLTLKFELKLIADAGIIGLPNAGKSTLISVMTAARPKIADYPFTTLYPNLGVVQTSWNEPYTLADIPGIIEGAHEGLGLGLQFLRHIERTKLLVHVIDASEIDINDPLAFYNTINHELSEYSQSLSEKPQIIVLNKIDITDAKDKAELLKSLLNDKEVFLISAATNNGIEDLKQKIGKLLKDLDEKQHY